MINENMLNEYKVDETVVGKWIDGKPIYRKTILFHLDSNNNYVLINHNIQNLDKVINYSGFWINGKERRFIPEFYLGSEDDFKINLYMVNNTEMRIIYGSFVKNYAANDFYVTLYYTKTTD